MNHKNYKKAFSNIEKFAKDRGINLEAYDLEFLCGGYNCSLTWNPAYHIMPHSEPYKTFLNEEARTLYYTYFQLSKNCSSICSSSGDFDKTRILQRLQETRKNEKLNKLENLKWETDRQGLKLFAITFYGDKFGLIKANDIKMDNDKHEALIVGGEYNGYTISIQGYFQIIGIHSDMTKYIAQKRWVDLKKEKGKKLTMNH